ncbi:MAG: hypothetical protein J6X47_10325 [Clostridia bacterium]|nr:hypothetical protein [Clostridia bacterium]
MKDRKLFNAITKVDEKYIENAANAGVNLAPQQTGNAERERPASVNRSRGVWIIAGAAAACLVLVLTALIVLPALTGSGGPGTQKGELPKTAPMKSGNALSGVRETLLGERPDDAETTGEHDMMAPGFPVQTVVEAEVLEVLPDLYYIAGYAGHPLRVAKLRVREQLCGNGFPEEIYLRYSYYDEKIFDGFEYFYISLHQIGIEDYALVNGTANRIDFFPNMFDLASGGDVGYGSVIAIHNGKVDGSFWEKANYSFSKWPRSGEIFEQKLSSGLAEYPATRSSTAEEVKANILEQAKGVQAVGYITSDDVFVTEEAKALREYLKPAGNSMFSCSVSSMPEKDRASAWYTRYINGFPTEENILINWSDDAPGGVERFGEPYTAADIANAPDLGELLANLNLSELTPRHIENLETVVLKYAVANGIYRKVDGKVYGIIRVLWYYKHPAQNEGFIMDDTYFLYGEDGTGREVTRDELREVIGDDTFIAWFPYGDGMYVIYCY